MKKLKLDLDTLAVETFATDRGVERRGTVGGHDTFACITARCLNTDACTGGGAGSCNGTCYATCGDVPCASWNIAQCGGGTAYEDSCIGGGCFNTDNDNTCINTCLNSCPC